MSKKEDIQNPDEKLEQAYDEETVYSLEEQVETLTEELSKALQEAGTNKDIALRAQAESENVRRRAEREVSNASKFALEKFAREILAVVDSLEKALELPAEESSQNSFREGIELTHKLLIDTLKKFSIEQINPVGELFDPALHEAMVMQESEEHDPNSVMHVIQPGFSLNGRLIRPARVIVAKGKSPEIDQKA
ncbi:MAG: nucleotide exchange factor GrpE [Gammaproteobacteria bacterium]|nr:nucleotide exchange factor GrpE [Gammaproteobacteria bacterium]MDH5629425.1 nucleotide exchange factor GrpE [Gammaproteobacteria bacterium]